jgi:hypothetical protein
MKKYKASIIDRFGKEWVFEGVLKGNPMWTPANKSRPKPLTEVEAYNTAMGESTEDETPKVSLLKGVTDV